MSLPILDKEKVVSRKISNPKPLKDNKWNCPECGLELPEFTTPPCPKCGSPIEIIMSRAKYNEILKFLIKNKGSHVQIILGKDQNKDPILLYKLMPKQ